MKVTDKNIEPPFLGAYYGGVTLAIFQEILTAKDNTISSCSICRDNDSILHTKANSC